MAVPFKIDLRGKTAVVTGGGGVLCSAFCEALAECGASVAVLDLTVERAAATADRIRAQGGQALPLGADVLDRESLQKALVQIEASFGAVGSSSTVPAAITRKHRRRRSICSPKTSTAGRTRASRPFSTSIRPG